MKRKLTFHEDIMYFLKREYNDYLSYRDGGRIYGHLGPKYRKPNPDLESLVQAKFKEYFENLDVDNICQFSSLTGIKPKIDENMLDKAQEYYKKCLREVYVFNAIKFQISTDINPDFKNMIDEIREGYKFCMNNSAYTSAYHIWSFTRVKPNLFQRFAMRVFLGDSWVLNEEGIPEHISGFGPINIGGF